MIRTCIDTRVTIVEQFKKKTGRWHGSQVFTNCHTWKYQQHDLSTHSDTFMTIKMEEDIALNMCVYV